jgi:hypothetical protein
MKILKKVLLFGFGVLLCSSFFWSWRLECGWLVEGLLCLGVM